MRKLVIFDYTGKSVHVFCISKNLVIDDEFIETLGFRISTCYWMEGDLEIIQHSDILE